MPPTPFGFCGASYTGYATQAAAEECRNLFPEKVETQNPKSPIVLVNAPGKRSFATVQGAGGRGIYTQNGRCFVVFGNAFSELYSDGTTATWGSVDVNSRPAQMVGNGLRGNQIFIVSGGLGYIFNTVTNVLAPITHASFPANVINASYLDGYFIATTADRFVLSASLDGTAWTGGTGQRLRAADNLVGALVDHGYAWFWGNARSEVWYDSGAASFPLATAPGAFIETGLAAPFAAAAFGDSIGWLASDERGGRYVVRNQQGYNPVRISTHAIEQLLRVCTSVDDAVAWAYELQGHVFWVLSIPSQALTLVFDEATELWHQLGYWDGTGVWQADRGIFHAFCFGKHLTCDRTSSTIWELSLDVYADGDKARRWVRRSPYVAAAQQPVYHDAFCLHAHVGVGLTSGQGVDPTVEMRFSDDQGTTWSNARARSLGALGKGQTRVLWQRNGRSRNRIYEVSGSDPVKTVLVDGYLTVRQAG